MVTKTCVTCKREFQVTNDRKDTARFCQYSCRKGINTGRRVEYIKKNCESCSKEFEVEPNRRDARFCNMKCYGQQASIVQKGTIRPPRSKEWSEKISIANRGKPFSPERRQKQSEALTRAWAEGKMAHRKPAVHRRQSREEISLKPYLSSLGYEHNDWFFINYNGKTRLPDYVDRVGKRVVEYFGSFWHPKEDEEEYIRWYREAGWECRVIWYHQLAKCVGV